MAERKPLVLITGEIRELPDGDTLPLPEQDGALIDGGTPSTPFAAPTLRIDFGGVT